MSTSSAAVATPRPARPSALSSIRRHLAALVLVVIFASGLALALALAVSPRDLGNIGRAEIGSGLWAR